jgi:hypothetical protein
MDRIKNVFLHGKSVSTDSYLQKCQLIHSMRFYDLAGWEPQAIPVSHAWMCTHCLEVDSYQKDQL